MRRYWRTGYEATSIQDLVEATGLNRGSLYGAFGDKHALLLATLDRYRRAVVGPWLATLGDSGAGAKQLRRFLATLAASATADPERRGCLLVNMAVERAAEDPAVGERAGDYLAGLEDGFARALQRPRPSAGGREPDGRAA
ncbi:MAG: TetR/AcrR family transcriptional regulator, partial [Alphaproteobacteria bacterium]